MEIPEFIQLEAQLLDEQRWDEWLELYHPQCEYWVPMWHDDGEPTRDPRTELSLIYYASRSGLEDRVFRLKSGRSSASVPLFRTCHMRSAALVAHEGELLAARLNWTTHCFRLGEVVSYFGRKTLWIAAEGGRLRIMKAHTLVCNDRIDHVLDIYQL